VVVVDREEVECCGQLPDQLHQPRTHVKIYSSSIVWVISDEPHNVFPVEVVQVRRRLATWRKANHA